MQSTIVIINLFGAVALLLFGLAQVKDGVTRAFGSRLRTGLASGTQSGLRSFAAGFLATIALQSSTATALTVASFVERDLIRARMAQIVLLGANVGTAVTAFVVATGIEWLSPLLIIAGVALQKGGSTARRGGGTALIGIGLMLLSLDLLSAATEPMRASPALAAFIKLLDGAWPVAFALTAGLAIVSSSSLAVVVLVLSLAGTGILSTELIIVLILGANLGGAIGPVLATLSAPASARRITTGNLVVRAVGCLIALPFVDYGAQGLSMLPLAREGLPVDAHLAFNIALALLAWPFSGFLSDVMKRAIPAQEDPDTGPRYLDPEALSTPVVALANATREVLAVGDLVERMLVRVESAFRNNDLAPLSEIEALEKRVDRLQQDVKVYLSKLGWEPEAGDNTRRSGAIIDYAINLEHVGDIIEKGLGEQVRKKVSSDLKFSEAGYQELKNLFDLTIENLRTAQTIIVTGDLNLALRLMEIKVDVRKAEKLSAERHLERLRDGRIESLQTSSLHLDILRDLKRINAHLVSVAHPILDDSGLLRESRLRQGAPKV
ncbi:Na/Pi cotransporter family protein [Pseudorhizobium pelagicum]|uniref:Sodium:phosphate symporter n=1 Tax=Pseudorhizobium pelagicum TaxID=1509405 RepID=A0A922NXG5_9HYPH|nr:Na/Pi cotransporter family protein [Pseudorhizobium pelagicum]KEQ02936.1 sodium:phosphate symporter [Pseudorhizobium pelagicum]KEQ04877.1 sodium:phosphate symporter [Pseudorhizobium pelagicum]